MPRPAKSESETRGRLLHAAMLLFWEHGYEAAAVADILKKAGANSGSFYYFFSSKEDLLRGVLDEYLTGLEPVIMGPAREAASDPLQRIFAVLAGYREKLVQTGCTYGCPLGRLALEIDPARKKVFEKIAANMRGWVGVIQTWLDEASDRLPPGTKTEQLATFVLVTMEGGVMLSRTYRSLEPFDAAVSQLRQYFELLGGSRTTT
jgi:TetR/AcrR family transcriptional regulator, transcriptional repressor for nem operon